MIADNPKVRFETYGGLHTIYAANKVARRWKDNTLKLKEADPRWTAFPARIFLFPKSVSNYSSFLRQLGEEDNQNLRYVSDLFVTSWLGNTLRG